MEKLLNKRSKGRWNNSKHYKADIKSLQWQPLGFQKSPRYQNFSNTWTILFLLHIYHDFKIFSVDKFYQMKLLCTRNTFMINFIFRVGKYIKLLYRKYVIHYTICRAVCFQLTHSPCDDWDNTYTLSYHHHQIGSMNYCPLFRVRSWNNGVRCMSIYILMGR